MFRSVSNEVPTAYVSCIIKAQHHSTLHHSPAPLKSQAALPPLHLEEITCLVDSSGQ